MNRLKIDLIMIGIIGLMVLVLPLNTNVKGDCWSSNQLKIMFINDTPVNATTLYGNSITIKYFVANVGTVNDSDSQQCIDSISVISPEGTVIYSATNTTTTIVGSRNFIYTIPVTDNVGNQMVFTFNLGYYLSTSSTCGQVCSTLVNQTTNLTYTYGGSTAPSDGNYTVYIIIIIIIGVGIVIIFIGLRTKKNQSEDIPDYCNAFNPMTNTPYLYNDVVCRQKYLKKYGRLPEEVNKPNELPTTLVQLPQPYPFQPQTNQFQMPNYNFPQPPQVIPTFPQIQPQNTNPIPQSQIDNLLNQPLMPNIQENEPIDFSQPMPSFNPQQTPKKTPLNKDIQEI